ncbi:MAG: hypothetical protein ABIO60_03020 [Aquaticitalea sp.]
MKFNLQHRQILRGIPSASGIEQIGNELYVIGDNSPWLYQLNELFEVIDKHLLLENVKDNSPPKALKPDFEAMKNVKIDEEMELLIFWFWI